MNYAIRITLPFDLCKDIISKWSDRCKEVVVYQHSADEEISKTHIHLALYGCEVKAEALKRMWIDCPGKGNEFWSWKDLEPMSSYGAEGEVRNSKYITYMSKGNLAPVFIKNISEDLVERSRQNWVEPVKADKTGDPSEKVIKKVIDSIKESFVYDRLTDEDIVDRVECSAETLCKIVRRETFRQLWGEHRRFPHGSHFKIVAGTAYMRLCEHYGCFEEGMEIISQLWL